MSLIFLFLQKELKNDVIDFIEDLIEDLEFPPTPAKLSKKDLIKNLEDFAIVDENAKKVRHYMFV